MPTTDAVGAFWWSVPVKARTRALIIVVGLVVLGGGGYWAARPDETEELLSDIGLRLAAWRDDLRRKGADMVDSAREVVGLDRAGSETPAEAPPAPPPPVVRHVVWASADGQLLRAEVPAPAHEDFVVALRQSQSEDLNRLARLAEKRFRQEAEPLVKDVVARVPAFMTEALGGAAQYAAAADTFAGLEPGMEPAALKDKARQLAAERLTTLYRDRVLRPDATVPELMAVSGRVIADVRTDLIRSCDRYDDAFRAFLRANVKQVQALSPDGRWSDVAWDGASASFRSLCQTLRASGVAASWFDEAVTRAAGEPSMTAHELLGQMAQPAAGVAERMMQSYDGAYGALAGRGLPQPLSRFMALAWSYGASSPDMFMHVLGFDLPPELRDKVEPALAEATRAGMLDVVGSLNAALVTFVDGELAGMASGVTARVDGSWSRE